MGACDSSPDDSVLAGFSTTLAFLLLHTVNVSYPFAKIESSFFLLADAFNFEQ